MVCGQRYLGLEPCSGSSQLMPLSKLPSLSETWFSSTFGSGKTVLAIIEGYSNVELGLKSPHCNMHVVGVQQMFAHHTSFDQECDRWMNK